MKNHLKIGNCQIQIIQGDITSLEVDAIVNPANKYLRLGSGVAGAIRQRGGPRIQYDCDQIGSTRVGQAVITSAGKLRAKYIIHAVGPKRSSFLANRKLRTVIQNTLKIAVSYNLNSIAIPAISTGVFGFPVYKCAYILLQESIQFLIQHQKPVKILFCLMGDYKYNIFEETINKLNSEIIK